MQRYIWNSVNFDKFIESEFEYIKDERQNPAFWIYFHELKEELTRQIDFLSRIDEFHIRLKSIASDLGGGNNLNFGTMERFRGILDKLKEEFAGAKSECLRLLENFDEEEENRLNEAFHSIMEGCYWSAIINSAVALEKRLFSMMKRRNTIFLRTKDRNLHFTLGQLAKIYLDNRAEFKNCIPVRYEQLLSLVNSYRIVSAHPKQLEVDVNTANAILNLTLRFLLDESCQVTNRKKRT